MKHLHNFVCQRLFEKDPAFPIENQKFLKQHVRLIYEQEMDSARHHPDRVTHRNFSLSHLAPFRDLLVA